MALIFFGILFVLGATGMDQRRGIRFALITSGVLFAWTLLIVIDRSTSDALPLVAELITLLIAFSALSLLSFFMGRWVRLFFVRFSSRKSS
jgi:hypothetical protein